ncbi:hypothetical protein SISSUDRAFT_986194 [Sistotremastrum suecicum HHB10207 ss-3]|uniref:C2H2-type domain-containing protein n=1 Tax=Sistotremastrum suecicum HHB10207 ss-3 TaxID=1314776 RepID=A0A166DF62_9AGAM|nr:hypothetical protein SISSUDRAFT_986194 [Sistotremastrum suecicum HHB10207 ss-3]
MLVNGIAVPATGPTSKKPYQCTHAGCTKRYSKPSRLEEHERTHSGERPFSCSECPSAYFRESHLKAHVRTHLPESERPFVCEAEGCQKRFWTTQHLKAHGQLHRGARIFECTENGCDEAFSKNYQLRSHIAEVHRPEGTKPFICEHEGCPKSFATNQKLRVHSKVHDERRYSCSHSECASNSTAPLYFATWTALQAHMKSEHPPACPYPSCNGRTFASQKGLRGHLKVHEDREIEDQLKADADDEADGVNGDEERYAKRRRGGDVGRDWVCVEDGCDKAFKSNKALKTHVHTSHLHRRDFVCPAADCGLAFGYKHVLQRHISRCHAEATTETDEHEGEVVEESERRQPAFTISSLTGKSYSLAARSLPCPWPRAFSATPPEHGSADASHTCPFAFTRSYDLRRHLKAQHGVEKSKAEVERWVKEYSRPNIPLDPALIEA